MASRNSAATWLLSAPLRPEQAAQHVVRLCSPLFRNTSVGGAVSPNGFRGERLAEAGDGAVPVGPGNRRRREVQPGFELSQRLVGLTRAKVGDPEVDIDGGRRWQERDCALQAGSRRGKLALLAQGRSEKGILAPAAGSSRTLSCSSDTALSFEPLYHSATPRL